MKIHDRISYFHVKMFSSCVPYDLANLLHRMITLFTFPKYKVTLNLSTACNDLLTAYTLYICRTIFQITSSGQFYNFPFFFRSKLALTILTFFFIRNKTRTLIKIYSTQNVLLTNLLDVDLRV